MAGAGLEWLTQPFFPEFSTFTPAFLTEPCLEYAYKDTTFISAFQ